jgi:hypothetical protein
MTLVSHTNIVSSFPDFIKFLRQLKLIRGNKFKIKTTAGYTHLYEFIRVTENQKWTCGLWLRTRTTPTTNVKDNRETEKQH